MVAVYACPQVAAVRALYSPLERYAGRRLTIRAQLSAQARRLLQAHREHDSSAHFQITCWHPDRIGRSAEEALSDTFTEDDARLTIAREHGYQDWPDVEERGGAPPDADFEDAVDAALAGDLDRLREQLGESPKLATQRSAYAHRAGLIHYMAANGVETYRQVVPANADTVVTAIIAAGADVNAVASIYGGSRALGLLVSSAHPRAAGLVDEMAAAMRAAGAN